jgi:membrane-bound inhibitor of C-type lysozyme
MAGFAKQFAFVSAVATPAFAGPALATEARYTCSDGSKLTAQFSPPDTAKGSVALTFATGRELKLPQVLSADGGRYADAAERHSDDEGRQRNLLDAITARSNLSALHCHPTA